MCLRRGLAKNGSDLGVCMQRLKVNSIRYRYTPDHVDSSCSQKTALFAYDLFVGLLGYVNEVVIPDRVCHRSRMKVTSLKQDGEIEDQLFYNIFRLLRYGHEIR